MTRTVITHPDGQLFNRGRLMRRAALGSSGICSQYLWSPSLLEHFPLSGAIAWIRERRSPAVLCNTRFERWLQRPRKSLDMGLPQTATTLRSMTSNAA